MAPRHMMDERWRKSLSLVNLGPRFLVADYSLGFDGILSKLVSPERKRFLRRFRTYILSISSYAQGERWWQIVTAHWDNNASSTEPGSDWLLESPVFSSLLGDHPSLTMQPPRLPGDDQPSFDNTFPHRDWMGRAAINIIRDRLSTVSARPGAFLCHREGRAWNPLFNVHGPSRQPVISVETRAHNAVGVQGLHKQKLGWKSCHRE